MPKTALTQQDLRLYASQRLTDTPDGGGKMTAQILSGKPNELFPPVSDIDLVTGRVNARLVYCAAMKPVPAALWGAHVIISEPPKASHLSFLAFRADHYGQERQAAMARVEAYAVPATRSRMVLLNTQLKGSRTVTAYQRPEAPLPVVGERYCLQYADARRQKAFAYFRVVKVSDEVRTFVDVSGEFQRRVLKLEIQDPLERDFEGMEIVSRGQDVPDVLILETQIADSGRYYGIRPLAAPVRAGDVSVQADGIYEQLVPTSTVETALTDGFAGGKALWVPAGARREVARTNAADGVLYLDTPVLPGSVELDGWEDDASGSLKKGASVLAVDYEKGVIHGIKGAAAVFAVPAVRFRNYAYAAKIEIDQTNIGTEHVLTLRPRPASGSVSVVFRAGRTWYWLHDNGDGWLRDAQGGKRGKVEHTGSVRVSLPVQPDAGSQIVCYFAPAAFYKTVGGADAGAAVKPLAADALLRLPLNPKAQLKPGSIRLSWQDGSAQRSARDQNGELEGSCTGYADYPAGVVHTRNLRAASVSMTAEQYLAAPEVRGAKVKEEGANMVIELGGRIQAGSLSLRLPLGRREQTRVVQPSASGAATPVGGGIPALKSLGVASAVSSVPNTPSKPQRTHLLATSV